MLWPQRCDHQQDQPFFTREGTEEVWGIFGWSPCLTWSRNGSTDIPRKSPASSAAGLTVFPFPPSLLFLSAVTPTPLQLSLLFQFGLEPHVQAVSKILQVLSVWCLVKPDFPIHPRSYNLFLSSCHINSPLAQHLSFWSWQSFQPSSPPSVWHDLLSFSFTLTMSCMSSLPEPATAVSHQEGNHNFSIHLTHSAASICQKYF